MFIKYTLYTLLAIASIMYYEQWKMCYFAQVKGQILRNQISFHSKKTYFDFFVHVKVK